MTADVELVKGHNGQWLVDYWMAKRFHGPPALAKSGGKSKKITRKAAGKRSHTPGKAKAAPPAQATDNYQAPHASRAYWAIPAAILSLIVLIPIGLGTAHWRRGRKAKREYEAWQASRSRDAA